MWSLLVSSLMVCASAGAADLLKGLVQGVQQEAASISRPVVSTVVTGVSTQCSNVKKLIGVDYEQVEGRKEPDLNQLSLKYVTPKLNISFNINTVSDVLLHLGDQKLAIFVHGFTDDPSKDSFRTISSAFLETGKYHVLALDGSSLIRWLYLRSTTYVRFMGEKLGTIIAGMVNAGYDPSNLHLVGHSLGAHISGFTGKQFTLLTGLKVARVTGLDPAGPCFSNVDPELRLKATDAAFVDVIHTDGGVYGMTTPVGQVDFFPNDGQQQPNCLLNTCSHSRAWQLFAESILKPYAFPAVRCDSWQAFRKNECSKNAKVVSYMGLACLPGTTGLYYLQTAGESPYGLGEEGAKYRNNEGLVKNIGNLFGK